MEQRLLHGIIHLLQTEKSMNNHYKPSIVVFGCTGTVGSEVIRLLSTQNCFVRGILRNPSRTYPVVAFNISYVSTDLHSQEQLKRACTNADSVFLLTATSPQQIEQEINIIHAAKEVGVQRIVKLSAPIVSKPAHVEVSHWHQQIETVLANQFTDYAILRPYAFMQNWERNTFTMRTFGEIYGSLGNAARNYVDCRDVAEVAVKYLLSTESLNGESLVLTGAEAITNQDMAQRFSHIINRRIKYVDISSEELKKQLMQRAKLPNWLANHIVELDDLAIKIPEPTTNSIEKILNRKPRIMDAYLQEFRHLYSSKPLWKFWVK